MIILIATILSLTFSFLVALHWYQAFGGKWKTDPVFPAGAYNTPFTLPTKGPTLIVAFGLFAFACLPLLSILNLENTNYNWLIAAKKYGLLSIIFIFVLRTIGEFKHLGFLKKVKHSKYDIKDSKIYSPFCAAISILALILYALIS